MKIGLTILALAAGAIPAVAFADTDPPPPLTAEVNGRVEHTDNALLTPETGPVKKQADQIFIVNPAIQANATTRGVKASIEYQLNYFHYSKLSKLDRALHDLDARAALVYWESVDLDAQQILAPQPLNYASPLRDPVNDIQASRSLAHAGLHHEFNRATRAELGYRAQYVTYFKVHKGDALFPDYLVHGPEISAERDVGPRLTVGLQYSYHLETFQNVKSGATAPPDWQAHVAALDVRAEPTDWLGLHAKAGVKAVTYTESKENRTRFIGDAGATAGGPIGHVDLRLSHDVTQDLLGNPATISRANLGVEYAPTAPWGARVDGSYGTLQYDLVPAGIPGGVVVTTDQSFFEAGAGFSYRISPGVLSLGASHHESLTKIETFTGDSKVVVNRAMLTLGGKF